MSRSALACAAVALLAACNYGFQGGGGFPEHIRTIYVEPFDNRTPQFELDQQVFSKLLERLPGSLGVRPAGRESADALITGSILSYQETASNYRRDETGDAAQVLEHEITIRFEVSIIDVARNLVLYEQQVTGRGTYPQDLAGGDRQAREEAIEHLIQQVLDGAQSQW